MMSISKGMNAGQAGGYFSKEDYYLKGVEQGDNSLWVGKGSEALGLAGEVRERDFRAVCRGEEPATGARMVAPKITRDKESGLHVETHRSGNDCTFSAPKSVSIAYAAGVAGIKEAHDAAVLSVAGHLEKHYSHYRSPQGIKGGGLVAAKFDHATSRNIDPQLHSHVFVVNAVYCEDGAWKANEPNAIFQDQKSLGLLYRQELAHELRARGFEVVVKDRAQMFIELKGIDPALIGHFSSRREAIERQVALWNSEGRFAGVPHARLHEMAALETRDPKMEMAREDVVRMFERGFEACGSSMERVKRELEEGRSLAVASVEPAAQVVGLAARELIEREAVLDRARLLDQAVRISGGSHGGRELSAAIDGGTDGVVRLGRDARGREFYTTKEMLRLETSNLERIRELPAFESAVRPPEIEAYLERLAGEGIRLTAGQKGEIVNELTGSRGVALSLGDPGTAKTSTLGIVERFNEEVLRPDGREHFTINLSYTGKAARELGLATGRPAFTIASFQNGETAAKFALQRANGEPPMLEAAGEKILIPEGTGTQVVIRVDEAGFLGARHADRLLTVVEELNRRGIRVKLHLLGDGKQMQGIQAGDLLRQLRESGLRGEVDYAHLDEILRQRDPGLLEVAKGLNREDRPLGENAREALSSLTGRREVVETADPQELRRAAVEHYLTESGKPSPFPEKAAAGERQRVLLVTTTNAARGELNREIRAARVAAGEIGEGKSFPVLAPVRQGVTVESYRPGDTVLFSGDHDSKGRVVSWGARLHTEGKVLALDRERNLVRIGYSFAVGDREGRKVVREVVRDFPAAELAGRTTLSRLEERNFAVGDRVVMLKNDAALKVQNGSLGVVRELDEAGRMRIDLGDREVTLDLASYRQLDHAYAVTIHKSQGATVDHSILFAPVRPRGAGEREESPEESYGRMSYNALNVAVTRARYGVRVFTNSIEDLTRSVQSVEGKSSTLAGASEPGISRGDGRLARQVFDLKKGIGELERAMFRSGGGARRALPSLDEAADLVRVPGRRLPEPVREIPAVGKEPRLEPPLPKRPGLKLER